MAFTRRTTHVAPATAETIAAAAACLRAGGLVAMPTETVYGLAADATSDAAVAGIYAAKGRPTFNPLIAHVLDVAAARREGAFSREAEKLAEAFWPGPLTLVAPAAPNCRVSLLARAGLDTLAIRVPAHETARALIEAARTPLVAPSANRSGRVSPTTAQHVLADLEGRIDWILDGGPSRHGLEIDDRLVSRSRDPRCCGLARLRARRSRASFGRRSPFGTKRSRRPNAPGQLESHYAPRARLRLEAADVESDEAALDFAGALAASAAVARLDLSPSGDLVEAASNLFAYLRALDETGRRA